MNDDKRYCSAIVLENENVPMSIRYCGRELEFLPAFTIASEQREYIRKMRGIIEEAKQSNSEGYFAVMPVIAPNGNPYIPSFPPTPKPGEAGDASQVELPTDKPSSQDERESSSNTQD